jgi:hypothetical protein
MTTRTRDDFRDAATLFERVFSARAIRCLGIKLSVSLVAMAATAALAQTVYMQDTPADTGIEPNPDTGPMWVSEDIWVRNSPDPGWQPYPFTAGSPPWTIPAHQNPVYRDPLKSTPNYVYVQVRNQGTTASTGTERLRLYWAKASTGLSWPSQWVDYQPGGLGTPLYGGEITKPRINAATATAAEQTAYVNAILAIGTNSTYTFPMGTDFWETQQQVHMEMGSNSNIHGTSAFTPWHREFINRYEVLLQQYDPTVKLLYWDWTTDPSTTLTFMGSLSGPIGAPFNPMSGPTLLPLAISRSWGARYAFEADSLVVNRGAYGPFSFGDYGCSKLPTAPFMAPLEGCSHDDSHGNIGGNMGSPATSAQDPFFFLLHTNVDRLWAQWQRTALSRLDPAQTYGPLDQNLSLTMSPWDGSPGMASNSASSFQIQPWETSTPAPSGGNYVVAKFPSDASVVSPPIYDTAPLYVPLLQPGQAVVLQIPWYPPNPVDFASFGADQGHVCLLARIETSATAPYGMDFAEGSDVFANTKNNNKIVWKNVTVVDDVPGPHAMRSVLVRNPFQRPVQLGLRLSEPQRAGGSIFRQARLYIQLPEELYKRWRESGGGGRALRSADGQPGRIEVQSSEAWVRNIRLNPGETFSVGTEILLSKNYAPGEKSPYSVDLIQTGTPEDPEKIVGGQRFSIDLRELVLVKPQDEWRYWDRTEAPAPDWRSVGFNDGSWQHGAAPFGSDGSAATRLKIAQSDLKSYFRRVFEVEDPGFYRNLSLRLAEADGAIVYLNGREIDRVNLPAGALDAKTRATRNLTDLEGRVFVSKPLDPSLLRPGKNALAVEIRGNPAQGEMRFDAELVANSAGIRRPPDAAFPRASSASLYQPGEKIPVNFEALSDGGNIESVSLYVDGALVSTQKRPPYSFVWTAGSPGPHRLRAVAVDAQGLQSAAFQTITIVEHVPPTVKLLEPQLSAAAGAAKGVTVAAEASDRLGKIARVEFWVKDMAAFTTPNIRAATVSRPPYRALLTDLKPGHYMLWAFAVNDHGVTSQSFPGHFVIEARK